MSKEKKKTRKTYDTNIINALIEKYGVSRYFITESIKGHRNSVTSESIRKEYNSLSAPTLEKIKEFKKQNHENRLHTSDPSD